MVVKPVKYVTLNKKRSMLLSKTWMHMHMSFCNAQSSSRSIVHPSPSFMYDRDARLPPPVTPAHHLPGLAIGSPVSSIGPDGAMVRS